MFTLKKPKEPTDLDVVIQRVLVHMEHINPDTPKYNELSTQLVKLYKLRAETEPRMRVSADTWALIGANLAGILIVVGYEHGHVITSKALGFISKLR
jgi:hypothetical protein